MKDQQFKIFSDSKASHMKTRILMVFVSLLVITVISCTDQSNQPGKKSMATDTDFDIVILNGRVMDPETEFDAIRNVGLKDGIIGLITEDKIRGKETIDATGLVVSPGFIDMHHHNVGIPFGQKLALRDGVTTTMELEAGVFPIDTWYASLHGKSQTNYGASVGTIPVREYVFNQKYKTKFSGAFVYDLLGAPEKTKTSMLWSLKIASQKEMVEIEKLLKAGLSEGAIGIGHCPGYMVKGSTQKESTLAQRLAAEYGQSVFLHGRFSSQMPPTSGTLGFMELLAPQSVYGGGLVIQHLTAQALANTPEALQMVDDARGQGIKVLAEIYPYNYGSTILAADYLQPSNYKTNMKRDFKDIVVTETMEPLDEKKYNELLSSAPSTAVMFYNATEEIVNQALAHPSTVLGSDAFPYTVKSTGEMAFSWDIPYDAVNGHPRGAGSHAKLLRLTREKAIDIPLSLAISKMSFMIANYLNENGVPSMSKKGRLQVGMDADITIFDPKTVTDNAKMDAGGIPSTGIPFVVVNGTVVVDESKVKAGVYPGKPVFGSGENTVK